MIKQFLFFLLLTLLSQDILKAQENKVNVDKLISQCTNRVSSWISS